jgi:hypothetical protein
MAGLTTATFHFLVDVNIVQVDIVIPEIGQRLCLFIKRNVRVVTLETRCIVLSLERHIKFFRKVLSENAIIVTSMRAVTGVAVTLLHRAVLVLLNADIVSEFFVAPQTQIGLGDREEARMI